MGKNILVGGAWPYANSSLHLGHIAGLIGGDIIARFHRQLKDNVIYVSGSDCHGTPITQRAKKEGIAPNEICETYHKEFDNVFKEMNFSYDMYTKTTSEYHKNKVEEIFKKIYDNGYIYEKEEEDIYCPHCNKFLSDREIMLICPDCGAYTNGDECDCGRIFNIEDFKEAECTECHTKVVFKNNKNLYLSLSKLQDKIQEYVSKNEGNWRINAQNETNKYLKEGLRDRAVTRDIEWGVNIPIKGYENKRMYVWIEAVLGYITITMQYCEEHGLDSDAWLKNSDNNYIYMAHGKDNIVFHTLIYPGLLLAIDENYRLPDMIVSTEYLNYYNQKFSKSKGIGPTIEESISKSNVDTLRFHLIKCGPEKKDANYTEEEYKSTHNEITNKLGNFVNRTLKYKGLTNIPNGIMDEEIKKILINSYDKIYNLMEKLEFREVCLHIIELLDEANKYYDSKGPWKLHEEDINEFNNVIYTCCVIIANISNYINFIMPQTAFKIRNYLNVTEDTWKYIEVQKEMKLENIEALFERM